MSDIQESPSTETGATGAEAVAVLAEIRRRQGRVVKAVLVPGWYWWVIAAGMVAIGVARDSGDTVARAVAIPLAVLVMVGLTGAMIPAVRRRVQVHSATKPGGRGAAAIFGMIVLVDGVTVGVTAGLAAGHFSHPATIGAAAGAAVIVIAGPPVNRYLSRLMLSRARQHTNETPDAAGSAP